MYSLQPLTNSWKWCSKKDIKKCYFLMAICSFGRVGGAFYCFIYIFSKFIFHICLFSSDICSLCNNHCYKCNPLRDLCKVTLLKTQSFHLWIKVVFNTKSLSQVYSCGYTLCARSLLPGLCFIKYHGTKTPRWTIYNKRQGLQWAFVYVLQGKIYSCETCCSGQGHPAVSESLVWGPTPSYQSHTEIWCIRIARKRDSDSNNENPRLLL